MMGILYILFFGIMMDSTERSQFTEEKIRVLFQFVESKFDFYLNLRKMNSKNSFSYSFDQHSRVVCGNQSNTI